MPNSHFLFLSLPLQFQMQTFSFNPKESLSKFWDKKKNVYNLLQFAKIIVIDSNKNNANDKAIWEWSMF